MAHLIILFCTKPLGYQNGKTTTQPVKPSGNKKHQRTGTSDGCQRIHSQKLSRNNGIRNVVKLLENISQAHGDHKPDDQAHRISHSHIIGLIFCHFLTQLLSRKYKHFLFFKNN